ncbi:MAG: phosphatase PAP2 family protein [Micropruina sp.]|uniref:phosphatase PAP2 family protein n=1 Tax=Micropruina sp. TaxID=2737536 RepID=UPI0039E51713
MSRILRAATVVGGLVTANVLTGRLITGPLRDLPVEHRLNHDLRRRGGDTARRLAAAASQSSDTAPAVGMAVGLTALLLARGRRAEAAVPALAMALASLTHVTSSALVGRPRPALERLGTRQPTSSFPSGHVGAMTALAVVLGRAADILPRTAAVSVRVGLVGYLGLLGCSRLYNGQHYASDVLAGYVNGCACGMLARQLLSSDGGDR